jgi:hypothetical protein
MDTGIPTEYGLTTVAIPNSIDCRQETKKKAVFAHMRESSVPAEHNTFPTLLGVGYIFPGTVLLQACLYVGVPGGDYPTFSALFFDYIEPRVIFFP